MMGFGYVWLGVMYFYYNTTYIPELVPSTVCLS